MRDERSMRVSRLVVVLIAGTLLVTPLLGDPGAQALAPGSVTYDFEGPFQSDPTGQYVDDKTENDHRGYVKPPGKLALVPREGGGQAAEFCEADAGAATCPRLIIEIGPEAAADLNPKTANFSFGADVLLKDGDIVPGKGSNIIQKGSQNPVTGQWKLQTDGGKPSCVLLRTGAAAGEGIFAARSTEPIVDGAWHRLTCIKAGNMLKLQVGDVTKAEVALPENFLIENQKPVRIGGKSNTGVENDQFFGRLDNVFFRLDP